MFDCYRKEMAVNEEDIQNILVAVLSGDEQEIYKALTKKKEIIDNSKLNVRCIPVDSIYKVYGIGRTWSWPVMIPRLVVI